MTSITLPRLAYELLKYARIYKRPLSYDEGYTVSAYFLKEFFNYTVWGKENIPKEKKYVACSNHASFLDMLVLGEAFYPDKLKFLAKPAFFEYETICRKTMRKMHLSALLGDTAARCGKIVTENITEWGAEKVYPGNVTKTDLKRYIQLAKENNMAMFPEGHRTKTGEMQPLQPGAMLIAQKSKNPIIPAAIEGTFQFWKDFWHKKRNITVSIGEPMHPADYKKTEDALNELDRRIKKLFISNNQYSLQQKT